jgi:hypothetical protein
VTVAIATLGERALRRLGVVVVASADRPSMTTIVPAATIATGALIDLTVIASDETPSAADQAFALGNVGAAHDSMVAQAFVSWDIGHIPLAVADEYTSLTSWISAPAFGKPQPPLTERAALEARVKRASLVMGSLDIAMGEVMTVHYALVATGRARWSSFDIPLAAEDVYVDLAAANMAPLFGVKADLIDRAEAYRQLARIISLPSSGESVRAEYF